MNTIPVGLESRGELEHAAFAELRQIALREPGLNHGALFFDYCNGVFIPQDCDELLEGVRIMELVEPLTDALPDPIDDTVLSVTVSVGTVLPGGTQRPPGLHPDSLTQCSTSNKPDLTTNFATRINAKGVLVPVTELELIEAILRIGLAPASFMDHQSNYMINEGELALLGMKLWSPAARAITLSPQPGYMHAGSVNKSEQSQRRTFARVSQDMSLSSREWYAQKMVEHSGLEPLTSSLPARRSSQLS